MLAVQLLNLLRLHHRCGCGMHLPLQLLLILVTAVLPSRRRSPQHLTWLEEPTGLSERQAGSTTLQESYTLRVLQKLTANVVIAILGDLLLTH